jgi:NitT/TauT family transport system permease protein
MNLLLRAASVALLLAAWFAGSHVVGARLLPEPQVVALAIVEEARSGALGFNLGITLARVVASFAIAMALGSVIGLAMGRVLIFDRLADSWLVVLLNLPALVIIVLAYVWAGLTETAAIIAVALNKLPIPDGSMGAPAPRPDAATRALPRRSRALRPVARLEDRADRRTARPTERRRL